MGGRKIHEQDGGGRVRAKKEEEDASMPPEVVSELGHLHYCRLLLEVAKLNPKPHPYLNRKPKTL